MKRRTNGIVVCFAAAAAWILYSSNSLGFDNKNYSGTASSKEICSKCHAGGANLGGTVQIKVIDKLTNLESNSFITDRTYRMNVKISANSGKWKGIHASIVDADNKNQGSLSNAFGGAIKTVRNIQVFTHYPANDSGVFAFDWTPNQSTADTVQLFYAAIAGDGKGGNSGDQTINSSLKLYKDKTGSLFEPTHESALYPNPVSNYIYSDHIISGAVYNSAGQKILGFKQKTKVNLQKLKTGQYYIRYSIGENNYTTAIIKL